MKKKQQEEEKPVTVRVFRQGIDDICGKSMESHENGKDCRGRVLEFIDPPADAAR